MPGGARQPGLQACLPDSPHKAAVEVAASAQRVAEMTLVVGAVAEAVAESVAEAVEAVLLGVAVLSAVEVAEVPRALVGAEPHTKKTKS